MDVEKIYMDHPFDKIVMTTSLHRPETEQLLRDFCKSKNIPITRLVIGEEASEPEELLELSGSFRKKV